MKSFIKKFLFFFLIANGLSCVKNLSAANTIEDTKFGIKINHFSSEWDYKFANNDSLFQRIIVTSKKDNFCFIVYASKGQLKHEVTDKYDSILLKKNYKKPSISKVIEEYGMKGIRNIYHYTHFNKKAKKNITEYLSFDILYKKYVQKEEYFYLIYSYTTIENDPRVSYIKSMLLIEPPEVSFWKTTFGSYTLYMIYFFSYLIVGIGLIFLGKNVLRVQYDNIKRNNSILCKIKQKVEFTIEAAYIKKLPFKKYEIGNQLTCNFDELYHWILKDTKRDKLIFSLSIVALLVLNFIIIFYAYNVISDNKLLIHIGIEIALILGGFFNLEELIFLLLDD
jgi:hypothetical protein